MKSKFFLFTTLVCMAAGVVLAQYEPPPQSLLIPDKLETPIGTLHFNDGAPDEKTVQVLYDNLDFLHAQNVFLNTYQGASTYAFGEGYYSVGAKDNDVIIFSDLMD